MTPNIYWQKCNKYNCRLTSLVLAVVEKEITEGKKSYIEHLCFTNIAQYVNDPSLINTWKLTPSVQKVANIMSTKGTQRHMYLWTLSMNEKLQLNYKMLKRLIPLTVHRFSSLSSTAGILEPNSYNSWWEAQALKLEANLEYEGNVLIPLQVYHTGSECLPCSCLMT